MKCKTNKTKLININSMNFDLELALMKANLEYTKKVLNYFKSKN